MSATSPFLGEILAVGFNFAPVGWGTCQGQLLPINQNTALFALIGTFYGGNGQTTFALPDLRGRIPVGMGQGPGLANRVMGEQSGTENTTLLMTNMAAHTHTATFNGGASTMSAAQAKATTSQATAVGDVLARAQPGGTTLLYAPAGTTPLVALGGLNVAGTVTNAAAGGGLSFSTMQPFRTVNMIIALEGIFPSRN